MANNNSAIEQLKDFLNELFQFDSQDLDFGIYKILNYKRKEIKEFIEKLLVDRVKEQLLTLTAEESQKALQQLKDFEQDEFIQNWINGTEEERNIGEKLSGAKIAEYRRIKTLVDKARVAEGTENHIYNHLTLFFSRYYDKGDFISKRRFGKNEKYVVPYNGEETHFYWANHDQYYIKSSETFQQYAFKIPVMRGNMVINFKLTSAQVEQGNVKADEPNFFILSEKEAETGEKEATFFFEYRPLSDDEKKTFKGNNKQDILNERAFEDIEKKYNKVVNLAKLWETDAENKPLLLKKLNHYTRKNKYDFFIHKNLKGFLQRELDYYIKSELISVDDLYVTDVDSYFDRLKHNIKTIKVFKNIADTIIDFVSQIEDFQKKLWEKKKFVLSTEWVITVDRLVRYIGEEASKPFLETAINNQKQVDEWKELFGEEIFDNWENIHLSDLVITRETKTGELDFSQGLEEAKDWLKLPIDTVHFPIEFKINLLNKLSEKVDLEAKADGLVIHSDNYHGLITLHETFKGKIGTIYTDPPYNAKSSEIIYKNTFKHSSWLALMNNSIAVSKDFLNMNGSINIAIDDYEYQNLHPLVDFIYGSENFIATVLVIHNPRGRNDDKFYGTAHEYMLVYAKNKDNTTFNNFSYSEEDLKQYNREDYISLYAETSFMRTGNNSDRSTRPNLFYPIYFNQETNELCLERKSDEFIELLPINSTGEEKTWRWGKETFEEKKGTELFVKKVDREFRLFKKRRLIDEGKKPKTVWHDSRYDASSNGITVLKNLFGRQIPFSYPKALGTVLDAVHISSQNNDIILDFFPGSGTTFHSIQLLNHKNKSKRKCILIEQGNYIFTVIIPRIKKVAYTFDWKEGKPKNGSMNGLGIFFKYQRLEQYEEALENIAFTASKDAQQQALKFDQYIPKYMLEFETKNSQTLVNTEAMKDTWDYKLKVWDGFTYDTERAVDLVETFNYLIGLHMQKCITKELNGKKYQFVSGQNNSNKQILVVWRSVKDWKLDDYKVDGEVLREELKNWSYDLLYINEQAHVMDYQPIEEIFKNKMLA